MGAKWDIYLIDFGDRLHDIPLRVILKSFCYYAHGDRDGASEVLDDWECEDTLASACRLYNAGYNAGHNDTVEGDYTQVLGVDADTYHSDVVTEFLDEGNGEVLDD